MDPPYTDEEGMFFNMCESWNVLAAEHLRIGELALATMDASLEEATKLVDEASRPVRTRKYKQRKREIHNEMLNEHYFDDPPFYDEKEFRRRYRMSSRMFRRIVGDLESDNPYFQQHPDATGRLGFTAFQKATVAMRMIAFGITGDACDEYLQMAETTAVETMKEFCEGIVRKYRDHYLRAPTALDVQRLIDENETRGFPGMLGSVDCMHWQWKNCPSSWQGQFIGHVGPKPTVILEAVADRHNWFWHVNFGIPGSNNDLNVLNASSLFTRVLNGQAPPCNFNINGRDYTQGYYLGDGIYPAIATIVKGYKKQDLDNGGPRSWFNEKVESVRKDVERAFGVLRGRFAVIQNPCRYYEPKVLGHIMRACIILNNMIVEDQRVNAWQEEVYPVDAVERVGLNMNVVRSNYRNIYSKTKHNQLRQDLTEQLWNNRQVDEAHMNEE